MTANERLEALLNRAGQTISDLPRKWTTCASEPYSGEQCYKAHGAAWAWYVGEDQRAVPELEQQETTRDSMILRQYILHLTDIIDRMETALANVIGERDWLVRYAPDIEVECNLCVFRENISQPPCDTCTLPPGPNYFEYAGVPGDWRTDE